MKATLKTLGSARRTLLAASLMLAAPQLVEAQVGLRSGVAQVALVARSAPRGSIQGVGTQRETARQGTVREVSVTVGLSANTGYQLIVRGTSVPSSRVWVRSATGEYQELTAGSSVTVARDAGATGELERDVHYRIEVPETGETLAPLAPLPVRYEIAINPVI